MTSPPHCARRVKAARPSFAIPITFAAALATAACGDDPDGPGGTAGSGGMTATGSGVGTGTPTGTTATGGSGGRGVAGYPGPPYGNQVGDVMPLLLWEGYVNQAADAVATTQPYVDWSTDDVRTSAVSHALVHLAAVF